MDIEEGYIELPGLGRVRAVELVPDDSPRTGCMDITVLLKQKPEAVKFLVYNDTQENRDLIARLGARQEDYMGNPGRFSSKFFRDIDPYEMALFYKTEAADLGLKAEFIEDQTDPVRRVHALRFTIEDWARLEGSFPDFDEYIPCNGLERQRRLVDRALMEIEHSYNQMKDESATQEMPAETLPSTIQ